MITYFVIDKDGKISPVFYRPSGHPVTVKQLFDTREAHIYAHAGLSRDKALELIDMNKSYIDDACRCVH